MQEFGPGSRARLAMILAAAFQFAGLFYWPQNQIPSAEIGNKARRCCNESGASRAMYIGRTIPGICTCLGKPVQAQNLAVIDFCAARTWQIGSGSWPRR